MASQAVYLPDAQDLDVLDVHPARDLEDANHLLGDHAALIQSYEDNGYL